MKNTNFIDHLSAKNCRRDSSKHLNFPFWNFPHSRCLKLFTVLKKVYLANQQTLFFSESLRTLWRCRYVKFSFTYSSISTGNWQHIPCWSLCIYPTWLWLPTRCTAVKGPMQSLYTESMLQSNYKVTVWKIGPYANRAFWISF